jgi:hypothetical protein
MKPFTERRRQWVWFGLLWCVGLAAAFLMAAVVRWVVATV